MVGLFAYGVAAAFGWPLARHFGAILLEGLDVLL